MLLGCCQPCQGGALSLPEIADALDLGSDLFKVLYLLRTPLLCSCLNLALRMQCHAVAIVIMVLQTRHWHIQACSGVTGDGLVEGIDWIVSDIGQRIFMMD